MYVRSPVRDTQIIERINFDSRTDPKKKIHKRSGSKRLPIREGRDYARWAIEIVQNDVTEAARRQGGKQRREPLDRHYCSVRSLIAGESVFNAMSTNWRIPKAAS